MVREASTVIRPLLSNVNDTFNKNDGSTNNDDNSNEHNLKQQYINNNNKLNKSIPRSLPDISPLSINDDIGNNRNSATNDEKSYVLLSATSNSNLTTPILNSPIKNNQIDSYKSIDFNQLKNSLNDSNVSVFILDIRCIIDFEKFHVKNSVNVELPTLISKRLKKGAISNFNILNFLSNEKSKSAFNEFKNINNNINKQKMLIVYDEDMDDDTMDSDAWLILSILNKNQIEDFDSNISIYYYKGGFDGILRDRSQIKLNESDDIFEPIGFDQFFANAEKDINYDYKKGSGNSTSSNSRKPSMQLNTSIAYRKGSMFSGSINTSSVNSSSSSTSNSSNERKKSVFSINTQKINPITSNNSSFNQKRNHSISFGGRIGTTATRNPGSRKTSIQFNDAKRGSLSIITPVCGNFNDFRDNSHSSFSSNSNGPNSSSSSIKRSALSSNQDDVLEEVPTPTSAMSNLTYEYVNNSDAESINIEGMDIISSASTPASEPISEITSYLYLGSDYIPQSNSAVVQLSGFGITHILNMAAEVNPIKLQESGKFDVKWVKAEDYADHKIEDSLMPCVEWIFEAKNKNPNAKIFVHCHAGRSRSATVVLAYLILKNNMTLNEAYDKVKRARPGVSPNIGFMMTLQNIDKAIHGKLENNNNNNNKNNNNEDKNDNDSNINAI